MQTPSWVFLKLPPWQRHRCPCLAAGVMLSYKHLSQPSTPLLEMHWQKSTQLHTLRTPGNGSWTPALQPTVHLHYNIRFLKLLQILKHCWKKSSEGTFIFNQKNQWRSICMTSYYYTQHSQKDTFKRGRGNNNGSFLQANVVFGAERQAHILHQVLQVINLI